MFDKETEKGADCFHFAKSLFPPLFLVVEPYFMSCYQVLDDCIFAFFAVEMVIKMVALGIFGSKCYFDDKWNQLDFVIVMAGLVSHCAFCSSPLIAHLSLSPAD